MYHRKVLHRLKRLIYMSQGLSERIKLKPLYLVRNRQERYNNNKKVNIYIQDYLSVLIKELLSKGSVNK